MLSFSNLKKIKAGKGNKDLNKIKELISKATNKSVDSVQIYNLNKVKSLTLQNYEIKNVKYVSKSFFEIEFSKQNFYLFSSKIEIDNTIPHYINGKNVTVGKISFNSNLDVELDIHNAIIVENHTSYYIGKKTKLIIDKSINDHFCTSYSNGEIKTTLVPSDISVIGSRTFNEKILFTENVFDKIKFKNMVTPRKGDQKEMIKSNDILKDKFNLPFTIKSFDNQSYFFYNKFFEFFLKQSNIDYSYAKLVMTNENKINTFFEEKESSLEYYILNHNNNKKKILKLKMYYNDIENNSNEDIIYINNNDTNNVINKYNGNIKENIESNVKAVFENDDD